MSGGGGVMKKKVFAAFAALLVSWVLGSGAIAIPMASELFEVSMSGLGDVSLDASTGAFSLGEDVNGLEFSRGSQRIGIRELTFSFLGEVDASLDLLFATADSTPWDVGSVLFTGTDSFFREFSGESWSDETVEYFNFNRNFTASVGDSLTISLFTGRDTIYETGIFGNIFISQTSLDVTAPVSEPATVLLFSVGLIGVGLISGIGAWEE